MKSLLQLILSFIFAGCIGVEADDKKNKQTQNSINKTVVFIIPDGFMPVEMPSDKIGLMMLSPDKPAGIFLAYTPENQRSENFIIELRIMYEDFFNDEDIKFDWKESVLRAHEGVTNETGKVFTAVAKDKELQVATYIKTIAEGQDVVYGYFAMKNTKSTENSAEFIDEQGKGINEFENFWRTVKVQG
jgi:hypothetical protein